MELDRRRPHLLGHERVVERAALGRDVVVLPFDRVRGVHHAPGEQVGDVVRHVLVDEHEEAAEVERQEVVVTAGEVPTAQDAARPPELLLEQR